MIKIPPISIENETLFYDSVKNIVRRWCNKNKTNSKIKLFLDFAYKDSTYTTFNDDNLKRAGMDYLVGLDYEYFNSYEEFNNKYSNNVIYYITRYGSNTYSNTNFKSDDDIFVMFGKESTGIPKEILADHLDRCLRIPMKVDARSLNLSNCVAIILFEILRQNNFYDLATSDYLKGDNFLEKFKK